MNNTFAVSVNAWEPVFMVVIFGISFLQEIITHFDRKAEIGNTVFRMLISSISFAFWNFLSLFKIKRRLLPLLLCPIMSKSHVKFPQMCFVPLSKADM